MCSKHSYSRDTQEGRQIYSDRIALCDLTHIMSIIDLVVIGVETPRIDNGLLFRERV